MSSAPPNPPAGDRPPSGPAARAPRWFHVMVKPIGSACNLDCKYCYYLHKDQLLALPPASRISPEVLETFIRSYIQATDQNEIVFTWQGGEPTLLGLDFFRQVVEFQRKHAPPGKHIANDLQTNGLLLDEKWCDFLRQHNFLVGLSIDGPKRLHDEYRLTRGGQPTFDRVLAALKLLKAHRIKFNTLTVVHRRNVKYPLDIYRFLTREVDSPAIQFIPCVEPKTFQRIAPGHWDPASMPIVGTPAARPGSPDSVVTDWSVDPDDFGIFLCKCFDEWHGRDMGKRMVTWFETSVGLWMGLPSQMCVFSDVCGKAVALERDGAMYSCDHFVNPEYRLGYIQDTPMANLVFSDRQLQFGRDKSAKLPRYCRECPYLFACHGECPKNRFLRTPDGEPGLNYLCSGLKRYFAHADERLKQVAARCSAP